MSALEELINIIVEFTPEQLQEFLAHPDTVDILQCSTEPEYCPPAAS